MIQTTHIVVCQKLVCSVWQCGSVQRVAVRSVWQCAAWQCAVCSVWQCAACGSVAVCSVWQCAACGSVQCAAWHPARGERYPWHQVQTHSLHGVRTPRKLHTYNPSWLSQCTAWQRPWIYYFKAPTICTLCARHSNTYIPSWAQPVYGMEASMDLLFQDTNNLYIMCATQTLTTHHGLSQCMAWQRPWNYNFKTPTICTLCAPLKHLQPIMGSASVRRGDIHGTTISRHQQSAHYVRHSNTYDPSWAQPVYGVAASARVK